MSGVETFPCSAGRVNRPMRRGVTTAIARRAKAERRSAPPCEQACALPARDAVGTEHRAVAEGTQLRTNLANISIVSVERTTLLSCKSTSQPGGARPSGRARIAGGDDDDE